MLVISEDGRDGSISIKQDADVYISRLNAGDNLDFTLRPQRGAWIQVVSGNLTINDKTVTTGDALAFSDEEVLKFSAASQSEFILFDLA